MLSAGEARVQTDLVVRLAYDKELQLVEKCIQEAISDGSFQTSVTFNIDMKGRTFLLKAVREKGYDADWFTLNSGTHSLSISWFKYY